MFKARTVKTATTGTGSKASGSKRRRREGLGGLMLAGPVVTVLCVAALPAAAGPRGERVVRGEASFNRQGRNTTITASDRAIIEYDSFNIGRRQSVEFIQSGANARVMNRITGGDPTAIRGSLKSNGIIYIVNPAGVIFGPNSVINVGGMYAAAATISDQDFVQGNDHFTNVQGRVVNHGSITGDSTVALIGRRVANFGSVVADTGTVTMVAGDDVWIGERNGHIYARFSTDAARDRVAGGVENHGTIVADQMMAGVGDYFALALFEPSAVRARIAQVRGGTGTTTVVAGVIDVSNQAEGGVGGQVTITGERVALRDAHIDASGAAGGGSVRVGGDYQGRGDIPNAERTFVSQGTTINADATQQGDGGRVIVWSDVFTNYNGSITARGGAQGGDGGFAEVSGKETLAFNGRANLGATDGDGGTLLLDPKNITIENGGNANVLNNNEFGESQGNSRSMDADDIEAILDTGTNLTLQANNDIVIDEAITVNNAGGDGGDFTLQAGRSIEVNANVTTDNGDFTATANETVANGVVDGERDDGAAVISMANGVLINAGSGNVSLTISTGAGLTAAGALSGNMTVEDITTTGTVTLTNNGPAAGSSILIEADNSGGNESLISAGSLAIVVGGAGGGGSIGTSVAGEEIAFAATNVEASGQSGGVFLDTAGGVNIGGASAGVTGLSTSGGGDIALTSAGAVTTSEAIAGTGGLDLTGTTVGISVNVSANDTTVITGPVTINGSRTISAGAGTLDFVNTVAMSGAGATVTLVGTPNAGTPGVTFQDTVTPDAGGTALVFETPAAGTAFNVATGNNDILEATDGVDQLQDGFDSITFGRADQATNITVGASTFIDPLVVRTTSGNINLSGALAGTDDASITLTPGAASRVALNSNGAAITTAGGAITINGNARVNEGFAVTIDSNGGNIEVTGTVDGVNAGAAEAITFDAGAGTLDVGTLGAGQALDLEDVTITNAGATTVGQVDLTGDLVTSNALTGAFNATGTVEADAITLNGTTFDFDAAVTSGIGGGAGAFTIGSSAATTLNFDSTVTGGSGGIDLTGTTQTFDALISTSGGGDVDLDGSAITLTGGITTAGANGNVALRNSGVLGINGAISATGSVTQTANGGTVGIGANVTGLGVTFNSATTISGSREVSATTAALAFNSTLNFSGGGATGTLTGSTIAFGAAVTGQAGGGGTNLVFQSPTTATAFGVGTGTANQMISSASIALLANGFTSIVFGRANASHDIAIAGVSFADPVTFRTTTAGNITLTGLLTGTDDATILLDTNAANRIILDVTGNAIVSAGDLIDLAGMVRVAEGEEAIIDSNGGTIRFGGAVDGTTGGAAESLTLDAGAGLIDFQTVASAVSGSAGSADATGLTDVVFTDAANVDLASVAITGFLATTNAVTGEIQATGTIDAGTIVLQADTLDFDAAVTANGLDIAGNTSVNFDSSVEATAAVLNITGGSVTIDGDAISNNQDIGIVGTQITLGGDVLSGGGAISLVGPVRLAQGATTEINSGGGLVSFGGAVDGTAGGAAETLTLNSGAGSMDFQTVASAISGAGGAASATGLTTVTIVDAGVVDIQSVAITGAFTTSNGLNGAFNAAGAVSAGTIDLVGDSFDFDSTVTAGAGGLGVSGAGTLEFGAAVSTSSSGTVTLSGTNITLVSTLTTDGTNADVSITNSGVLDLGGLVVIDGAFTQVNNATGTVTIGDDITTIGDMAFGSAVTIDTGGASVLTSDGLMSFADSLDMNGNALTLASADLEFNGGAGSVLNSGAAATLSLSPADDNADIDLGDLGGNARVGAWSLDNTDLGALDSSVGSLGFGNAVTGAHEIFVGLITALDFDVAINAPAGSGEINLFDDITTSGNSIEFNGDVRLSNNVDVAIDTGGGDASFLFNVYGTTTGGDESLTVDAGAGDLDFDGTISGQSAGGLSNATGLTAVTLTGNNVTIEGVDVTGALSVDNAGTLDVTADVAADGGFIQTNSTVSVTSAVTLSGDITTVNNDIEFASNVTQTGDSVLSAGTGEIQIGASLTFDTAGNNLTLSARDIDILGTLTGGDGTNTLTLTPDAVGTAIEIGNGTSNTAGSLVLNGTDISNIADGFAGIVIGIAGTGAHDFEIGGAGFTDPLTLNAPAAGGSFTVIANRTLSGTGDASLRFNGSHSTLTLENGSRITTAGTNIDIDDDILLADGAGNSGVNADVPLISSGGGDITIDGSIRGTDNLSGQVERLRIAAGTGDVVVGDVLTVNGTSTNIFGALDGGLNPTASAEGLVDVSIVSAANVTLEGVDIAGALETENALTGAFIANEAVQAQSMTLAGATFDFEDGFATTNNGGGNAAFTNSGLVTTTTGDATGDITTTGDLEADVLLATGSLSVGGDLELTDEAIVGVDVNVAGETELGDRIVAGDDIVLAGETQFLTNASPTDRGLFAGETLTVDELNTGNQDVTLSGAEIDFTGGDRSIAGGGVLTIEPGDSARDINLGNPANGNPSGTSLDLTDTDLAAVDSGFDNVTIGALNGTHDLVFGTSTFRNQTIFNYQNGTAAIDGNVFGQGSTASFLFLGDGNSGTTLSANITTAGGGILIDDNVTLGGDSTLSNNGGANNIEITGTLDGPFAFTALGGTGVVSIDGAIGAATALTDLSLTASFVEVGDGIGTSGAAGVTGITALNGNVELTLAGENFNTNQATYTTNQVGNILGNGSGTTATFTTNGEDITFEGGAYDIDDGVSLVIDTGGGLINLGATFLGSAGPIAFNSAVVLVGNTTITNQGTGGGDTVTFASTVDGAFDLTVSTAGGNIDFQGDIGSTDALTNLTVTSASGVLMENIGAGATPGVTGIAAIEAQNGDITYNGTQYAVGEGEFTASGEHLIASGDTAFTTGGGNLTFAGGNIALTNGSDLTVTTDGGDATFTTIRGDSDENLTVDLGAGTGSFQQIGVGNEIADIVLRMNNITLNGNVFGNTIVIEPGTVSRNIEIAGDGSLPQAMRISRAEFARLRDGFASITIGRADGNGSIVVGGDNGGALAFNDPLSLLSPESLGSVVIQETMNGAGDPGLTPASLTIDAGNVLLSADITTEGQDVNITGVTALGADSSITTDGGDITFADGSTINSSSAPASLTLDAGGGDVTVTGDIGGVNPLSELAFTGRQITIQGAATEGNQSYTGDTILNGNLDAEAGEILIDGSTSLGESVEITAGGDATFQGPIDGDGNDLTVTTDGGASILVEGAITDVGVLQMTSGDISLRNVATTGAQTYTAGTTTINGDMSRSDTGAITFNGDVELAGNSSISTDGGSTDDGITIDGDVDGAFSFNLTSGEGDIEVTGDVGGRTRLADMSIFEAGDVSLQGVRVANLRQTDGTGQTAIGGELDADGDTGVVMDSGSFRFEGPVNVESDLSLTSSEVSRFNNTVDVGGDVDLLGGSFRIGNDASDAFNVGGGLSVNSTGNLIVSAPLTVSGDEGATINAVDVLISRAFEVDAGAITLTNSGDFTLEESGSIVLNGNNFRQDGTGRSLLANGIAASGSNISFDGDIVMTDNLIFRGRSLAFNGEIDSDSASTRRALTLNSGGPVTLAGDIGRVNRIASLTTNANGETRLSADVFTAGRIEIGDDLVLQGDSMLNAADGGAAGTIEFLGAIDSESTTTPRSLTVITDVTILDHTLPTITFNQSIGQDAPLENLFLNYQEGVLNGRSAVAAQDITINGFTLEGVTAPLVPTILVPFIEFDPADPENQRGFFVETAGDFRMGVGEKLAVTFNYDVDPETGAFELNGNNQHLKNGIAINSSNAPLFGMITGGDAVFGDVVVDGNFTVIATGDIRFQQRGPSLILPKPLPNSNETSYPGNPEQLDSDDGTDIVVNGIAAFNKGPIGVASLGTTDLAGTNAAGERGDLILRQLTPDVFSPNDFFMPAEEAARVLGLSSFLFLDLRAEGSTGIQPPVFGQIPNETQSGSVNQATAIGSVAKRALADLGINARDPDDLLDALVGRALYNDLVSGEGDASYVTANRMSLDIATDLVNDYQAFFRKQVVDENGNPMFDPETGEAMYEPQAPIIRARLTEAVRDYRRQSGGQFDPIAFRQFVQNNEQYAQVEQDLDTLEHLLNQFQILGLSSGEFSQARLALLRLVRPSQGLSDQQFIAVIDAGDGVIETPAPTPAEPERIIDERIPVAPSVP